MKKHKITRISKSREDALERIYCAQDDITELEKTASLSVMSGMFGGICLFLDSAELNKVAAIICVACGVIFVGTQGLIISEKRKIKKLHEELKAFNEEQKEIESI